MHRVGSLVGGKYRLHRTLGEGGMGAVWAATNELIGKDVAIKMMQPHLAKNEDSLQRFFKEARICASIRDPGIVDVLDMGTADDGSPFIVMELLEGEPLDMLIGRSGRLAPDVIVPIVRDVAQTVALAHERNVVHRDLKPANIFLHRAGKQQRVVKVMDFGVSKVMDDGSPHATRTGALLGSPAYMSPEQAGGAPVDHRSDIYALGVILYEGLSGQIPFHDAPNMNALLVAIATKDPRPLAAVAPETPRPLLAIVSRAMQRDREARFSSAAEMAAALDEAGGPLGSVSQDVIRRSLAATELPSTTGNTSTGNSTAVSALGATMPGPTSLTNSGQMRGPQSQGRLVGVALAVMAVVGVAAAVTLSRTKDAPRHAASAVSAEPSAMTSNETAASPAVIVEPSTEKAGIAAQSVTPAGAPAPSSEPTSSAGPRLTQVRRAGTSPPPSRPPTPPPVRKADDFK